MKYDILHDLGSALQRFALCTPPPGVQMQWKKNTSTEYLLIIQLLKACELCNTHVPQNAGKPT